MLFDQGTPVPLRKALTGHDVSTAFEMGWHRVRQNRERLVAGSAWKGTGHVFTTTIGTSMDERRVLNDFKKALTEAGLPERRFHDARHTAATLLLAQGVSPRTVMEVLGHSQIILTMNTYAHVMPTMLEDAADKMDAILSNKRP